MGYSELIKNFSRIRAYIRSFYVYGFRHRGDFTEKSARSYDNERRRVESWLGDYMKFGQDADGRRVFLSVDSRSIPENPLYRAFRTKSFTDRDITLHFYLLDILKGSGGLSITEIMDELTDRLLEFEADDLPDESTVRKKLREYGSLGLVTVQKRGREKVYLLSESPVNLSAWGPAAAFFSEAAPLGAAGSFLQQRIPDQFDRFRFKHHYILNALDSEILYELLTAIGEKRRVSFTVRKNSVTVLPLKVYIGTQTGRQYLLATSLLGKRFSFYRVDLIDNIKKGDICEYPPGLEQELADFCSHVWGVTGNNSSRLEHIEMTVFAGTEEGHIVERLEREKRCGSVERLDDTHWRFTADVYDAFEMIPWLRTFTGRVTELKCTDQRVPDRFWKDLDEMTLMYGEDTNAVS